LPIRPKLFLVFFGICLVPLGLLASINYWNGVRVHEAALQKDQENDLAELTHQIGDLLHEDQVELTGLSQSRELHDYIQDRNEGVANSLVRHLTQTSPREDLTQHASSLSALPVELRIRVGSLLHRHSHFASISLFDQNRHPVFLAEREIGSADEPAVFRTKDFLTEQARTDNRVWAKPAFAGQPVPVLISPVSTAPFGARVDYTIPIFLERQAGEKPQGALLGVLKLDSVFSEAAARNTRAPGAGDSNQNRIFNAIILDRSGSILYHSNEALKHRLISESMPYFLPVSNQIYSSENGLQNFDGPGGNKFSVQYTRIPVLGAWAAIASNDDQALAAARRAGQTGFAVAVFLSLAAAAVLTHYWQRQKRGLERVTEGVEAIAKGKLDHRIEVRSSDDLRPLADNLDLMTRKLRDQIAREAETRQFQSFVRLSAILTHDLKNAIEALSLTVANMELHFDNQDFRADAMKSVTGATNNLRAMVERLSNPVTTLSGEHKRPQPVDLVPMLKRVISLIAEPTGDKHEIQVELPDHLFALVDSERINKVVENLIINALEAMDKKRGILRIVAGETRDGKPFFSVSDTGQGISQRFIEERLFHPFATTKKRGVGLGLYTCREVVVANGGSIEVESQEGAGTTFRVMLPSAPNLRSGDNHAASQPSG
jgi:signal transduction histidine kinase